MDMAYAASDLIVSRAGAMTCSEILATGKPSILVVQEFFCFQFIHHCMITAYCCHSL